jgi:hypothetical protein
MTRRTGVPSNAHYRRSEWREVIRTDPGYDADQHQPLNARDLIRLVLLIPAAIGLAIGVWAVCAILAVLAGGPPSGA